MNETLRIAVDAMGGDRGPGVIVAGAYQAVQEFNLEVILVGRAEAIERELSRYSPLSSRITIAEATEVIEMDESAALSVRRKKDSSINVAVNLVKEGKADAMVAAGNTGAAVCATSLGIAVALPTRNGVSLLIDVGANIDCRPRHLVHYAIMGDVYSRYILKKPKPRVGLLNVGGEATKGTDFIKEVHAQLSRTHLNFIGNVEGRGIFNGEADVIVCDGFVGNVTLKVSEGLAETIAGLLKEAMKKGLLTKIGAFLSKSAFRSLKKEIDYAEYGGAPLLGIDGICIIGHGRSSSKAIKNAIKVASEFVRHQVNRHIVEAIKGTVLFSQQ